MVDIALVGEAWGEVEERERMPFVGPTGYELNRMLEEAGIRRIDCFLTNVFNLRPPGNKIEWLCGPKELGIPGYPSLGKGMYVSGEYKRELDRLGDELEKENPNVIVALGNVPMWALLGTVMITKNRGVVQLSTHTITGFKVLPTYHPAYIFRQYPVRAIAIVDLMKAKRESTFPELRRPERQIWIEPTLEDIHEFDRLYLRDAERISVDIETRGSVITCIGFAPSGEIGIVIPFADYRRPQGSYWPSREVEVKVWALVRRILERPTQKTFQNGLYDIAFLWRTYKIRVMGAEHDTMLLHHALQPETLKSLGFLGSIYTDEGAWKQMRERTGTIKRED